MPSRPLIIRSVVVGAALAAASISLTAAPGAAQDVGRTVAQGAHATQRVLTEQVTVGRDISFPQCVTAVPPESSGAFGVLGTDNGSSFTRNPCLVGELAWAKRLPAPPAFYANTGNPGPDRAKHWPLGQTSPRRCSASDPNSIDCSYDYGWNAAWHSFTNATDAAQRLHHVERTNAHRRAANVEWWLDVETMNSWQTGHGNETVAAQRRDIATIAGEIDALHRAGVDTVGIYSTTYQWGLITGGWRVTNGRFANAGQWLAGFETHNGAVAGCSRRGFTGGPVRMTQYLGADGFDSDVVCA